MGFSTQYPEAVKTLRQALRDTPERTRESGSGGMKVGQAPANPHPLRIGADFKVLPGPTGRRGKPPLLLTIQAAIAMVDASGHGARRATRGHSVAQRWHG